MNQQERIKGFVALGEELKQVLNGNPLTKHGQALQETLPQLVFGNGWFTEGNLRHRLENIAQSNREEVLVAWLSDYTFSGEAKRIAVILAGNIPLVGFDDFRTVLISGHIFEGKLSSDDKRLLPMLSGMLLEMEPRFQKQIVFSEGRIGNPDAVIATGSNNSARYFDYYFSKYPHIIRKNRNSIAVLTGEESNAELEALGEDIFRYFGLGCRNVTKLFVPENYSFNRFFESIVGWGERMMNNSKYMNNYQYNSTLHLLNNSPILDNHFLILKEDTAIASPPGVLFYEQYESVEKLKAKLIADAERIQCCVGKLDSDFIPFGQSQITRPENYADGVNTLAFLSSLSK
jgi:hypothetical protein